MCNKAGFVVFLCMSYVGPFYFFDWRFCSSFLICLLVVLEGCVLAGVGAAIELALSSELGDPLAVPVDEVLEEVRIPAAELADHRRLLDGALPGRDGRFGYLATVLAHDFEHVLDGDLRDLAGGELA